MDKSTTTLAQANAKKAVMENLGQSVILNKRHQTMKSEHRFYDAFFKM